jgi:hypothetical protein
VRVGVQDGQLARDPAGPAHQRRSGSAAARWTMRRAYGGGAAPPACRCPTRVTSLKDARRVTTPA